MHRRYKYEELPRTIHICICILILSYILVIINSGIENPAVNDG